MARTACTEPQCLYKGALYLAFYRKQLCTFGPAVDGHGCCGCLDCAVVEIYHP